VQPDLLNLNVGAPSTKRNDPSSSPFSWPYIWCKERTFCNLLDTRTAPECLVPKTRPPFAPADAENTLISSVQRTVFRCSEIYNIRNKPASQDKVRFADNPGVTRCRLLILGGPKPGHPADG
jgi:hypothetical protein